MAHDLGSFFPLRRKRTHEVCGAGAAFFAFACASQLRGTVLWIREGWRLDQINPVGFGAYVDPKDLLVVNGKNQTEVLASAEEALRSGAVVLTVIELSKPLGLTEGRRLQLAAEAGRATGLCILSEGMGSNAAETRWRCAPVFDPADSTQQRWELIKNKSGTLTAWDVRWDAKARRVIVVSDTGERPVSQGASR